MSSIYLSAISETDLKKLSQWRNDAALSVLMMAEVKTHTDSQVLNWIEQTNNDSCQRLLGIRISQTQQLIGTLRFMFIDWVSRTADFGILLGDKESRSKGYGTQALSLALEYAFNSLNLRRITLKVLSSNEVAISVYRKAGFTNEGTLRAHFFCNGTYQDVIVMGILKQEYDAAHAEVAKVACGSH